MGVQAEMVLGFAHLGFSIIYGCTVLFVPDSLYGREHLTFKQRYLIVMSMSNISSVLEGIIGLSTLISCFLYIAQTYEEDENDSSGRDCTNSRFFLVEAVLSTGFAFHFALYFYLAPEKAKHLFNLQAVVDIVTIVPVYLTVFFPHHICNFMDSSLRFVRVVRLLRVLRSLPFLVSGTQNPIAFQVMITAAKMVVAVLFAAGVVHFLQSLGENEEDRETWSGDTKLTFLDALYFTSTTFGTVGYGDFSPTTWLGEIVTISLILFTIYFVPSEASKLSFLMSMQSNFNKPYEPHGAYTHVVVACSSTCRGIETFLQELYHDDHISHGSKLLKVVVLAPDKPDAFMNELLLKYSPGDRLRFIKGDARVHDDLSKAKVDTATACFILSDREAVDSNQEDATSVLRAMSIRAFDMNTTLYVQLIEPENKRYLVQAGIVKTHIVCINELEMKLTAQTCQCTGFAAFLTNLVSSSTFPTEDLARPWHKEYWSGLSNEIYRITLSSRFDGLTLAACAKEIYHQHHALFFAVKPLDGENVFLFPGSAYTLKTGDIGYFIAEHFKIVETLGDDKEHEAVERILKKTESFHEMFQRLMPSSKVGSLDPKSRQIKIAHHSFAKLSETKNTAIGPPNLNIRKFLLEDAQSKGSKNVESFLMMGDEDDSSDDENDSIQQVKMMKGRGPDRCSHLQKAVLEVWEDAYCGRKGDLKGVAQRTGGESNQSRHLERIAAHNDFLKDLSEIAAGLTKGKAHLSFSASEITSLLKSTNLSLTSSSAAIRDEVNFMEGHIVVITPNLHDIRHFLLPLRCLNTIAFRTVVILTPRTEKNDESVKWMKKFLNVFCIFGDRRSREDLERAGIARAFCVVVIAERRKSVRDSIQLIDPDADVVLTAKDIAMLTNTNCFRHMIVQLQNHNYIQHLPSSHLQLQSSDADNAEDLDKMLYGYHFRGDYHFQPCFAAGQVVLSSFAELLMAQCMYNPEIVEIIETLASGGIRDDVIEEDSEVFQRKLSKLNAALKREHACAGKKKLVNRKKCLDFGRSYPAQLNLPPDFAGKKTFGDLISVLIDEDIIPLALYRKAKITRGMEISFVYTNPPSYEKLQQGDTIFAIVHDLSSRESKPTPVRPL
jgi:hypothetical protein